MKKVIFIGIVLFFLVTINSLVHSIFELWQKSDLLTSAQKQLDREKERNQKLKAEYEYAKTQQFVEEEAYNKLFMSKPGEEKVIIAQKLIELKDINKEIKMIPNWQKWLNIFF